MTTYSNECCCGRELAVSYRDGEPNFTHADGEGPYCWPDSEPDLMAEPVDWDIKQPMALNPYQLNNWEVDVLADVAQLYVDAFEDDEMLSMTEKLALSNVQTILMKLGRPQFEEPF